MSLGHFSTMSQSTTQKFQPVPALDVGLGTRHSSVHTTGKKTGPQMSGFQNTVVQILDVQIRGNLLVAATALDPTLHPFHDFSFYVSESKLNPC